MKLVWDNSLKAKAIVPNESTRYGLGHTAPMRNDETNSPLFDLTGVYGKDIYSPNALRMFSHGQSGYDEEEAVKIINAVRNNPDAEITIYRGVPEGITSINKGDWVTLSPKYAQNHIKSNLGGKGSVLARKVKAKDLFSDANSLNEFGYDPED